MSCWRDVLRACPHSLNLWGCVAAEFDGRTTFNRSWFVSVNYSLSFTTPLYTIPSARSHLDARPRPTAQAPVHSVERRAAGTSRRPARGRGSHSLSRPVRQKYRDSAESEKRKEKKNAIVDGQESRATHERESDKTMPRVSTGEDIDTVEAHLAAPASRYHLVLHEMIHLNYRITPCKGAGRPSPRVGSTDQVSRLPVARARPQRGARAMLAIAEFR